MDIAKWTLITGWIFVLIWIPIVILSNRKTHPKALFVLFFAEMWERFSYYGMRALLTLYMVNVLFKGLEGADVKALSIYGSYTAMVYLFPVIGGLIADKIFGFKKAIVFGGILMMLGHFTLAIEGSNLLFFTSLSLIIVGNSYFKPNISSYLGTFYEANDPRKDGAFTIFYMGVNIGSFLATLTCGYVGQEINWHYGFGLAGIGMALGVIVFLLSGKILGKNTGLKPENTILPAKRPFSLSWDVIVYLGTLIMIPICAFLLDQNELMSTLMLIITIIIIVYLIYEALRNPDKIAGQRLLVVIFLFFFHAIFWALFEQAGGSLTLFADRNIDRMIGGSEIPASLFASFNPFYIMILAPLFSWIWISLNKKGNEPRTSIKFFLGLFFLALGFLVIVLGGKFFSSAEGLVPMAFLAVLYFFVTVGELCLSPVGLSMITKLSPPKIVGFVMGAWFLSISLGNKLAGVIGTLTASEGNVGNETAQQSLINYTNAYLIWGVVVVGGFAILLLILTPKLNKWMNGIH
ncbi:MAG: peptide MFS transporter [Sphingobacteriales bacterium]|nr:peptide MFS transporter [Sphingobacteriales bacterium]